MKSSLVAGSREADKVSMSCLSRKGRTGMRADVRTALEEGTKLDMWASRSAIKVAATGLNLQNPLKLIAKLINNL